ETPSIGRSNAVSAGEVAPCTNSRMRSEENFFIPAGCLLRTNSSIPGSPDGIMTSVVSSFGLAAWAAGLMRKVLAARHDKARHERDWRMASVGIVNAPEALFLAVFAAAAGWVG